VQILKKATLEKTLVILPESIADKTKVGWWKMDTLNISQVLNLQTGLGLTLKLTENVGPKYLC
jgi:hypothetical protein